MSLSSTLAFLRFAEHAPEAVFAVHHFQISFANIAARKAFTNMDLGSIAANFLPYEVLEAAAARKSETATFESVHICNSVCDLTMRYLEDMTVFEASKIRTSSIFSSSSYGMWLDYECKRLSETLSSLEISTKCLNTYMGSEKDENITEDFASTYKTICESMSILESIKYISRLINADTNRGLFDIVQFCDNAIKTLKKNFVSDIEIASFKSSEKTQLILCDETDIRRMFFSVLSLFGELSANHPKLYISINTVDEYVYISIAAKGRFSSKTFERIFNNKSDDRIMLICSVIEEHVGKIEVLSETREVVIRLPITNKHIEMFQSKTIIPNEMPWILKELYGILPDSAYKLPVYTSRDFKYNF